MENNHPIRLPAQIRIAIMPAIVQPFRVESVDERMPISKATKSLGMELSYYQPIRPHTGLMFSVGARGQNYFLLFPFQDTVSQVWYYSDLSDRFISLHHFGVGLQHQVPIWRNVFFSMEGWVSLQRVASKRKDWRWVEENGGLLICRFATPEFPGKADWPLGLGLRAGIQVFPEYPNSIQANLVGFWSHSPVAKGFYTLTGAGNFLHGDLTMRQSYLGIELRFGIGLKRWNSYTE